MRLINKEYQSYNLRLSKVFLYLIFISVSFMAGMLLFVFLYQKQFISELYNFFL